MVENRNMFIAIALSLAVIVGWQFFYVQPKMEQEQAAQRQAQIRAAQAEATAPTVNATAAATQSLQTTEGAAAPSGGDIPAPPAIAGTQAAVTTANAVPTAAAPRLVIETPSVDGSLSLIGARIDDLKLKNYHVTVDRSSPEVVLLSPSGTPTPYFVETGWVPVTSGTAVPGAATLWTIESGEKVTPETPVTLVWDNGGGLVFRRVISVDPQYMFTIRQTVTNSTAAPVSLHPYSRVRRQGQVAISGFFILHEGMIGVIGEDGLHQLSYSDLAKEGTVALPQSASGWLGITDKYWATAVIPNPGASFTPRFLYADQNGQPAYQADYLEQAVEVTPGATAEATARIFAGAKKTRIVQAYEDDLGIDRFNLMIDWGWFYFLTKPMFYLIDFIQSLVGNFGVAILIATVFVKALFFPLAQKAYTSMAKMKGLQPKIKALQDRFKDDKAKQQQEMMELYKKEKINPLAGCIPIVIQIPVFFALYKVLFVSIEMRHAPFFGWIEDLSAPDPSHVFNLFGLLPYDPSVVPYIGPFLAIGIWPILMGITMWVQMKMNPAPPDPTQAMVFNWMPVLFTFLLASFPAGLVIYWAWNNTLSVTQQYVIMRRQGVKVELWDNISGVFKRKPKDQGAA